MDDLIAFLRARLDEDEQVARAAAPGPWQVEDADLGGGFEVYSDESGVAYRGHYGGGVPSGADAKHIARQDPARVLREVEAKRRIIENCTGDVGYEEEGLANTTLMLLALPYADHTDYRAEWRP